MDIERLRQLTQISKLYYEEGCSQQEITDQMGISRPQVSRMLNEARETGIVSITIKDPFAEETALSEALIKRFGLVNAVVIDTDKSKNFTKRVQISRAAADFLLSMLKEDDILVVSPGTSIYNVALQMAETKRPGNIIVPISGGLGNSRAGWQPNNTVFEIAKKLSCKYFLLNAPATVSSEDGRELLMNESSIREVLDIARKANVALLGIGEISSNSTIVKSGNVNDEVLDELINKKACVSFANMFLDETGNAIELSLINRTIGLDRNEILRIPMKIAVAYGKEKIEAIKATLNGNNVNALVVDLETAKALI